MLCILGACAQLLKLLKDSLLLMDEVDVLLHPLRSELNFPIGPRVDLDLSVSQKLGDGIRWDVSWHILDALLFAQTGILSVPHSSQAALDLLHALAAKLEEGYARRVLQRIPHLVLLSRAFYARELKPLLVQWTLLYLVAHKFPVAVSTDALAGFSLPSNSTLNWPCHSSNSLSNFQRNRLFNLVGVCCIGTCLGPRRLSSRARSHPWSPST